MMSMRSALQVLLPGVAETALLRACLHEGEAARAGLDLFMQSYPGPHQDVRRAVAPWRALLPLLERSGSRNGLAMGADFQAFVRAARVREERRSDRYFAIAGDAIRMLEAAGVRATVVRGAALSVRVYEHRALRHCHDLDLLIEPRTLHRASASLTGQPFNGSIVAATRDDVIVEHESGLHVSLHTRPFAPAAYEDAERSFLRGRDVVSIDGAEAGTPSNEATLVHVLGHASCAQSRRNLRWVADAWHLIMRTSIDWDDVLARIDAHRLELPLSVLLEFIAAFGAPVPPEVFVRLRDRTVRSSWLAQDVALGGAVTSLRGAVAGIWGAAHSWRDRAQVVRWAAIPTPSYLRTSCSVSSKWLTPVLYLYRPVRFIARRISHRSLMKRDPDQSYGPEIAMLR